MALTVNNTSTLSLLNILGRTTARQAAVLERMATGSKINRGSDDPAGLLALTKLTSEITGVNAAIANNQRTDTMLGVVDDALGQISSLLEDIQRLANQTANDSALSAEEKAANQSQIDDALASIDRIASTTQFNGKRLIDGSLGINWQSDATRITDIRVFSRRTGTTDTALNVTVTAAASYAVVSQVLTGALTADTTFQVTGKLGSVIIKGYNGETIAQIAQKINEAKNETGVSADSTGTLRLFSREYGKSAFVRTKLIEGGGAFYNDKNDTGADAKATVNGQTAAVDGRTVSYIGAGTSVTFELTTAFTAGSSTLTIKGDGGATFQLGSSSATRATIGIDGVYTANLGVKSEGYLASLASGGANSVLTNPSQAATIAATAGRQIAQLQGRIGGFQKFQVQTSLNSLNDVREGLEKARGVVRDVDYALESSELNRYNVLMQSAMQLLGLANQQSTQVLALLR